MPSPDVAVALLVALPLLAVHQDSRPEPAPASRAAETLFSGPQPGEKVPPLRVLEVDRSRAEPEFDPSKEAGDAVTLYFVFGPPNRVVARGIGQVDAMAKEGSEHGLKTYYVGLAATRLEGEERLRGVWSSLKPSQPANVSVDGIEGPGGWGLNKKCQVTVVIAKGGKVVFNLAAIEPGETDYAKIREALSAALGHPIASKPAAGGRPGMGRPPAVSRPAASRPAREGG